MFLLFEKKLFHLHNLILKLLGQLIVIIAL